LAYASAGSFPAVRRTHHSVVSPAVRPTPACTRPRLRAALRLRSGAAGEAQPISGEALQLTRGPDPPPARHPFWSPDGRMIGFRMVYPCLVGQPCMNEIWVVNRDGTGRHLFAEGDLAAWSPDGRSIAVAETIGTIGVDQSLVIRVLDAVSGQGDEVLRRDGALDVHGGLAWAPDGQRIAFAQMADDPLFSRLYALDLTTLEITPLSEDVYCPAILGWTADGMWLAVVISGGGGLHFVRWDGACRIAPPALDIEGFGWLAFSGQSARLLGWDLQTWYTVNLHDALGLGFPEGVLSCPEPSE